jgi:phenylalanyl-tRNA synthetase alpha chain
MLDKILESALKKIDTAKTSRQLQDSKVEFLGKSSLINQEMSKLGNALPEERKELGQKINHVRGMIQVAIDKQGEVIQQAELALRFESEKLDLTVPARPTAGGSIHPVTQCMEELIQVFAKYGFDIKDGPSIEDDWYNFTALNIDENHPARQMHDTFYLKKTNDKTKLLRTHTSPIQVRTMQNEKPPYRFIAPGRTYRSDSDLTHTPMFHQIEGMVIDKNIHMGHLKYVIIDFIRSFFERSDIEVQFRPSFFPFTEPSAEVDIRMNKNDKWLEVLGCGMVHPTVLKNVGVDPEEYQGFAFGLGVERFAMLKYGIRDLRQFFEGDMRWLNHYNFRALDIPTLAGGLTR